MRRREAKMANDMTIQVFKTFEAFRAALLATPKAQVARFYCNAFGHWELHTR